MATDELLARHAGGGRERARAAAAGLPAPPALGTVVVTCMDARLDVLTLFGLDPGEVHVLRNAGGVVTEDVVRSVVISQRKLGTRDVVLLQHTGCGLATFTDDAFAAQLGDEVGVAPTWPAGTFRDPAGSVRDGLARLRDDPFVLPDTRLRGFVVDIATFELQEVVEEGSVRRSPAP